MHQAETTRPRYKMAFIRCFGRITLRKKAVLGTIFSIWIVVLVLQKFWELKLEMEDSYQDRQATLNNRRMNQSYLPIKDPVITPNGFYNSQFLVIILVSSSPSNLHRRNAIRNTWGRAENWNFFGTMPLVLRKSSYRTAFLIGTSSSHTLEIQEEIAKNHDMLIGNFTDSYKSLNIKVFMGLQWSLSIDCKYILKADDDVYVNVPLLSTWLNNKKSRIPKELYSGFVHWNIGPFRKNNSKHFLNNILYSGKVFPPYCAGFSYVLSRDLVSRILDASRVILPLWIEDVYIGMLVYYLGVRPLNHDGFHLRLNAVSSKELHGFNECSFLNMFTYGHQMGPKDLIHVHETFRRMNSRSNGYLVFQCMSKNLAFTMSVVVPSLLLSITAIAICAGVLRWIMLKRTTIGQ